MTGEKITGLLVKLIFNTFVSCDKSPIYIREGVKKGRYLKQIQKNFRTESDGSVSTKRVYPYLINVP